MAVNGILGIKLGMTQVFADDGTAVPCTVMQAGPCVIVQRRTKQTTAMTLCSWVWWNS